MLSTICPAHPTKAPRPSCAGCVQAVSNLTTLRKRKLDALTKENRARRQRKKERDEKRAYQALLASLTPTKRRERVRWLKDPDGWPRCSKHDERLAQKKNQDFYCRACARDSAKRSKPKRLERQRQQSHDTKIGTLYSIRSPLAHLIRTGIAPNAEHSRKRS